ncbi:MAG TPA: cupredoxin domain-containing protein [Solirubrobacteraceae bacterium]
MSEPGEPPALPHVQVSAVEYAFTLSRATVPAGKVVLQFVNDGQDEHNLKVAPAEGPLAGSFETAPAKAVSNLTLELHPGSYTLFCSLPTHEQKGMKATLTVE